MSTHCSYRHYRYGVYRKRWRLCYLSDTAATGTKQPIELVANTNIVAADVGLIAVAIPYDLILRHFLKVCCDVDIINRQEGCIAIQGCPLMKNYVYTEIGLGIITCLLVIPQWVCVVFVEQHHIIVVAVQLHVSCVDACQRYSTVIW